ncbi:MAG TPA: hypothetical protein VGM23_08155, partial [Armatimonadota bacterium]
GGDYSLRPLLVAAAQAWQRKTGATFTEQFLGQYTGRAGENGIWACGDGVRPLGQSIAIARDALVIIVSKNSKIKRLPTITGRWDDAMPVNYLGQGTTPGGTNSPRINNAYVVTTAYINEFFSAHTISNGNPLVTPGGMTYDYTGYSADAWQVYTYNVDSGTRRFAARMMGWHPQGIPGNRDATSPNCYHDNIGGPRQVDGSLPEAVVVENDADMVDKVAADPYGIGYCSSAFADLDRVQILAIRQGNRTYYFPSADIQHRGELTDTPDWPYMRTLYAVIDSAPGSHTFARLMLAPGGPGTRALQAGPLFQASYLLPK